MNSAHSADELADRLDQVLPPQATTVPDQVSDPPLAAALRLAKGPHPALPDAAVAQLQARVLAHADHVYARRTAINHWTSALRWAVAASLALMVLAVGTTTASADSLPGDTLYPVKRLVEQGRLVVTGDSGDISLRLDFANRRLNEFETMLARGRIKLDVLDDATGDMQAALKLLERGVGSRGPAAGRLVSLSERQIALAQQASDVAVQDSDLEQLQTQATQAFEIGSQARDLVVPESRLPFDPLDMHLIGASLPARRLGDILDQPTAGHLLENQSIPRHTVDPESPMALAIEESVEIITPAENLPPQQELPQTTDQPEPAARDNSAPAPPSTTAPQQPPFKPKDDRQSAEMPPVAGTPPGDLMPDSPGRDLPSMPPSHPIPVTETPPTAPPVQQDDPVPVPQDDPSIPSEPPVSKDDSEPDQPQPRRAQPILRPMADQPAPGYKKAQPIFTR